MLAGMQGRLVLNKQDILITKHMLQWGADKLSITIYQFVVTHFKLIIIS